MCKGSGLKVLGLFGDDTLGLKINKERTLFVIKHNHTKI